MINILYVVVGDTSFDEMFFLDTFLNQLPSKEIHNIVLSPHLPLTHINLRPLNTNVILASPDFKQEAWQELIATADLHAIILCDPSILLHEDAPSLTYFDISWLDDLPCPVALFDFRANLLKHEDGWLALDQYVLAGQEPPYTLEYDFLIKICPPHDALKTDNPRLLQWKNTELMGNLSRYSVRDETRAQLGCEADSKLISLVFPWENILMAGYRGWGDHFGHLVEMLIYYLNQLPGKYHLMVVNLPPLTQESQFDNVHVRYFEYLEQELLDSMLKATDLFITQSLTHPVLIQSALHEIPAICLGSSVGLENDQLTFAFESLSPFAQLKIDALREDSPELIFPYISFPNHLKYQYPSKELFTQRFFFFLADIFNEHQIISLVHQLLEKEGPKYESFRDNLANYRRRKLDLASDAESIVRTLITAPPRYLTQ